MYAYMYDVCTHARTSLSCYYYLLLLRIPDANPRGYGLMDGQCTHCTIDDQSNNEHSVHKAHMLHSCGAMHWHLPAWLIVAKKGFSGRFESAESTGQAAGLHTSRPVLWVVWGQHVSPLKGQP